MTVPSSARVGVRLVAALLCACSGSVDGAHPGQVNQDTGQASGAPDTQADVNPPPTTTAWSVDFTEVESLEGWVMTDCDGARWPEWRVQHDMIWLGRKCKRDDVAGPELKLGTALYAPNVTFNGGWIVTELTVDSGETFGLQYGGTHFTYYRVSMALKDLNARFDVVALPPFGVDGTVQTGAAALAPTLQSIGETLYVFPPYDTWFELALHWDGRRHELYVNRALLAEAELPQGASVLPGGPVAYYQHNLLLAHFRSLSVYPPGPPPWERAEAP